MIQPFTTTRGDKPRVAFVTCAELPDLYPDDRLAVAALYRRGVAASPAVWDDPRVDWAGYDLVLLRSTWDYPRRRGEFLDWAGRVPRLANPAALVRWNTDKRYLADLASAGVPVVPTEVLAPGEVAWQPPTAGEYVIKPVVGAGSVDAGRYDLADPQHRALAAAHVRRLHAEHREVLLQPYLDAVDRDGETALVYFAGRYSHAIRKSALLDGPYRQLNGLYKEEEIAAREPALAQLAVAEQVLGTLPAAPLYARFDLIPGPTGEPLLVELELAEPSLFLGYAPGAADRFADAVLAYLADLAGRHHAR